MCDWRQMVWMSAMFCPRSVARQKETKGANQSMVIGNISVVKCAKKARKGLETWDASSESANSISTTI